VSAAPTSIDQPWCVYCGASVRPRVAGGRTRNLDHFIPLRIIDILQRRYPAQNWDRENTLLACCPVCNNFAGEFLFTTFLDKFEYVRARRKCDAWELADNPAADQLHGVRLSPRIRAVVLPVEELEYNISELIWGFLRDDYTGLLERREMVI